MTVLPVGMPDTSDGWPDSLLASDVAHADVVTLMTECGISVQVDAARWHQPAGVADHSVIRRCRGPVVDIGSGPGRMLTALSAQGIPSLGVDVSTAVVARARKAGAQCVEGDVFDPVPSEGSWGTALLLDGNIGIGGDPVRLLRRLTAIVAHDGMVVVEVEPFHTARPTARRVRVAHHRVLSAWFAWAVVSVDELPALAHEAGWTVAETWTIDGRWFTRLIPVGTSS
jgi:SAM-dependent methyltransferase